MVPQFKWWWSLYKSCNGSDGRKVGDKTMVWTMSSLVRMGGSRMKVAHGGPVAAESRTALLDVKRTA
jgi:hypothetical protein